MAPCQSKNLLRTFVEREIGMSLSAVLFIIFASTATVSGGPLAAPSPYEVLEEFNFPMGLLPKGATKYELNNSTGEFKAYLGRACSFALQGSYELRYKPIISGRISKNDLRELKGVSVKVIFMWMDIIEVRRNSDKLEFSVGITSANFPMDDFEECPQCGCGFDCNDREEENIELNGNAFSY